MKMARRIENLPPYPFVEIIQKIAEKRAKGEEVITFAVGDPDIPTPPHIIEKLVRRHKTQLIIATRKQPVCQSYVRLWLNGMKSALMSLLLLIQRRGVIITRGTIVIQTSPERAFLVAVAAKGNADRWPVENSMEELAQLANTA